MLPAAIIGRGGWAAAASGSPERMALDSPAILPAMRRITCKGRRRHCSFSLPSLYCSEDKSSLSSFQSFPFAAPVHRRRRPPSISSRSQAWLTSMLGVRSWPITRTRSLRSSPQAGHICIVCVESWPCSDDTAWCVFCLCDRYSPKHPCPVSTRIILEQFSLDLVRPLS